VLAWEESRFWRSSPAELARALRGERARQRRRQEEADQYVGHLLYVLVNAGTQGRKAGRQIRLADLVPDRQQNRKERSAEEAEAERQDVLAAVRAAGLLKD
jgi:hypothetical protein